MRTRRLICAVLALVLAFPCLIANAQQSDDWVPHNMDTVSRHASFRTDFTFDRTMLALANNFIDDEDTRRAVAKLNGISVHL